MRDDDKSLRMLLANGQLPGDARERILDRVVTEHAPRRRWRTWLAAGLLPAAAAAAAVLVLRREPAVRAPVPKGQLAAVTLEARCPDRPPGVCHRGDRLLFEVGGARGGELLAAYAEHSSGERIWYYPAADGRLVSVPTSGEPIVLAEAARIGGEHPLGRYSLKLFLLERPTSRGELLSGGAKARYSVVAPLELRSE